MSAQEDRQTFAKTLNVSRETLARFDLWYDLLQKWSKKINLVSPGTLQDFWLRHALDSAQIAAMAPKGTKTWIDLGSGAGFPGLAIALMCMEDVPLHVVMVESNAKKAAFLRTCIQETGTGAEVVCERTELMPPKPYDVVSARALAPLPKLLELSAPFVGPKTVRLFPKGADVQKEIDEAQRGWTLCYQSIPSLTDKCASVLEIWEANRV